MLLVNNKNGYTLPDFRTLTTTYYIIFFLIRLITTNTNQNSSLVTETYTNNLKL